MNAFEEYNEVIVNGKIYHEDNAEDLPLPIQLFFKHNWIQNQYISVNTSGSTGEPKKLAISKKAMIQSAKQTNAFFNLSKHDHLLLCLPVDFIAGKMMVVRAMVCGANLVYTKPTSNPLHAFEDDPQPITFAAFTPFQVGEIIKDQKTKEIFENIKNVIIGGGEIPDNLEKNLGVFKNNIYATYGMTETITHIALRKIGAANKIYKAFKGIQLMPDQRGCLTISADYLGKDAIVTNDIVSFEGPAEFTFTGRIDNVINTGGIKVHAEHVEAKLREIIPQQFFIDKTKDEQLGEKVILIIEAPRYDDTTLSLLKKSMADVLHKYEVPKDIWFNREFVRTPTGKINKPETRKLLKLL